MKTKIHLLLTATVDPQGVVNMHRADPSLRLSDYRSACSWWNTAFASSGLESITICDNSNHLIAPGSNTETWGNIVSLTWDGQGFDRSLGKGYGEMQTIKAAFERLGPQWGSRDWVIKCNGRYRVPSINRLCKFIQDSDSTDLIADMSRNLSWCDSRFFAARVQCWNDALIPFGERLNDSIGFYFEHGLACAAHELMAQRKGFNLLPFAPKILGISGSMGFSYNSSFALLKQWAKRRLYPIKRAAFRA